MELGRTTHQPHQLVCRELNRLKTVGLLRIRVLGGKRHYEPDPDGPVARELGRLIQQTRGRIPRVRHALVTLRSPTLAWVVPAERPRPIRTGRRKVELIVLTGAPRSLVRVQLADVLDPETEIHCMSIREWVARLQKGDVFLRGARRGRKLWVLGSWEALLAREQAALDASRLLRSVAADWREELSDEWDEDWDPFAPVPGPG